MGGGGGTPLGPLLGPRPPMINNILGSDYPDYPDVSIEIDNEDFNYEENNLGPLLANSKGSKYWSGTKRTNNEEKP